jgi:hypothetical protein
VDVATADVLQARAAARGISVAELVAELVAFVDAQMEPADSALAELDQQWAAIEGGQPTVPHQRVARWLETWGTSELKPWHQR